MKQREFLEAVAAGLINEEINEEIMAYAVERLEALDAANEKKRENAAKKRAVAEAEKAPIRAAILAAVTAEPKTASTLIEEAKVEVKPQAIPSLLKGAIEAGTVVKVDVKIKGKGTQRGYQLAE